MSEPLRSLVVLGALFSMAGDVSAQVYGYTDDNGVLILSNVPTTDRMRLIVDDSAQPAGSAWHYSGQYDPLILRASNLFGVDSSLVRAVIAVESAFNRYARSHKGARGLMQLMPDTALRYGVTNRRDPIANLHGGSRYLQDLLGMFNNNVVLALAAYNAGENAVIRYGRKIPPYAETQTYVRRVLEYYRKYRSSMSS